MLMACAGKYITEEQSLWVNAWCDSHIEYYMSGNGRDVSFFLFSFSARADDCRLLRQNKRDP